MKSRAIFFLFLGLHLSTSCKSESFDHSYSSYSKILKNYIIEREGETRILYSKLKKNPKILISTVTEFEKVTFENYEKWSKNKQFAFLLNAYNLYVLGMVVKFFPITSVNDVKGFFDNKNKEQSFQLFQQETSLDKIEEKYLKSFDNPLYHFAIVCSSRSCPVLSQDPYIDKRIFSTRTYAFGFNLDSVSFKCLEENLKLYKIYLINFEDVSELEAGINESVKLVGLFIDIDQTKVMDLSTIDRITKKYGFYKEFFSLEQTEIQFNDELYSVSNSLFEQGQLIVYVLEFIEKLKPPRLLELVEFSAKQVSPAVFGQDLEELSFENCQEKGEVYSFDSSIMCETVCENIIGRVYIDYSKEAIKEYCPKFSNNIENLMGEYVNQFLGIVNHNINKLGYDFKISLPLVTNTKIVFSSYMPFVQIIEKCEMFTIRFGYDCNKKRQINDFKDIEFDSTSDELEFF